MTKSAVAFILLALAVGGCDDKPLAVPEGFERLGGEKAAHFVYVDPKHAGDRLLQRQAGKAICELHGNTDYCEVYMWDKKENVAAQLPVNPVGQNFGLYEIKDGRVKLKPLGKE